MGNKRTIAVVIAVLVCIVVIVLASTRPIVALRNAAVHIMEPVMRLAANAGRRVAGVHIFSSRACSGCDEEQARREVAEAKLVQVLAENESFKRLLDLKGQTVVPLKAANVLLYNQEWDREWLIIDLGVADGVRIGDPVVDESRLLVGDIAEVGDGFAKVAIASSNNTALSVAIAPSVSEALAKGLGARAFAVTLIPRDAAVHPGDVITRIFKINKVAPEILIGRMVSIDDRAGGAFKVGRATLLAHPERVNQVMVLLMPRAYTP